MTRERILFTLPIRRLRERILETGDGREDLGEVDEHVRRRLDPDVERRGERVSIRVLARRDVVPARVVLVDVVLHDCGPDHRRRAGVEAERDALDWGEMDAGPAERGINQDVADGDEDDERDRVEVRDDVVRDAIRDHRGSLRDQVVVKLVVGEPCRRVSTGPLM